MISTRHPGVSPQASKDPAAASIMPRLLHTQRPSRPGTIVATWRTLPLRSMLATSMANLMMHGRTIDPEASDGGAVTWEVPGLDPARCDLAARTFSASH